MMIIRKVILERREECHSKRWSAEGYCHIVFLLADDDNGYL